jgi:hypothetical protein
MKNTLLLVGLFAFCFSSLAQDGAVQIFERAKATHSSPVLERLVTYRDAGRLVYYNNGQVTGQLSFRKIAELKSRRVRFEVLENNRVVSIQQTGQDAWQWTQQTGVTRLPQAQAQPLQDSLSQTFLALRAKTNELEGLTTLGTMQIGERRGTILRFFYNGAANTLVVGPNGTIIGGLENLGGTDFQIEFSDYRNVGGNQLWFLMRFYTAGKLELVSQLEQIDLNPVLTEQDFAPP